MITLILKLKNNEGDFVAGGCIQVPETESVEKFIKYNEDIFKDTITEYNWEDDGSRITAMYIVRDSLFNIYLNNEFTSLNVSIYNIGCDDSGFDLINQNFIKDNTDPKYGYVSFNEQKINELSKLENTYVIEKAVGWQDDV